MLKLNPRAAKLLLNFYGPYLGAGVRVRYISPDWKEIRVSMKLHFYNRNAVGTHFGGSLYSMVDPHVMLMLMHLLGEDYVVWDKAAKVEFVSPGKGTVSSKISIQEDELREIIYFTNSGEAYFPEFDIQVLNQEGGLVAKIRKTLYVRKKR
ncbi:MAG: DUF4442 domain-containing protein [Cyanobacteria bacterium P01_F01_bin.53]